jgi:glutamate-1-semialdehyde aminotransferase
VWDVDGNEFLDYQMGIGPISLGYAYDAVDCAIVAQLKDGITFSMMHPLEVEVAELIRRHVPNAEMVRFSKTGAEVTSAAIRLARAYTGRRKILCCGYHGWHDWYIGVTDRNRGIPDEVKNLTFTFNYNDLASVHTSLDEDTAAVILEPMVVEHPAPGFLEGLQDLCSDNGTVLIFDEMWTGFRLALGGAQEYFGVTADLMCFSKAVANGMPISILAGRSAIMELCKQDVFFFTTFGGEALSLAAAKATIIELEANDVPNYLDNLGTMLMDGYNKHARALGMSYTKCVGMPCRSMVQFMPEAGDPLELKSFVQQELIRHGILWSGFHNLSYSHTSEDVTYTLNAYARILPMLQKAVESGTVRAKLRGEPVEPVFRRTSHFNLKPVTAVEVKNS